MMALACRAIALAAADEIATLHQHGALTARIAGQWPIGGQSGGRRQRQRQVTILRQARITGGDDGRIKTGRRI